MHNYVFVSLNGVQQVKMRIGLMKIKFMKGKGEGVKN